MKNIFKMMGLALIACSLMVACGPDKPEVDNTPSLTVKFNNVEWTPAVSSMYTNNYANFGIVEYALFKEANNYPFVDMMVSAKVGDYSHEATLGQGEDENGAYDYYAWQPEDAQTVNDLYLDIYNVAYAEKTMFQDGSADWMVKKATLKVTEFDMNTMTASWNLNATMYDFYSWNTYAVNNASDAETRELNVKANKFVFTQGTAN